MLDRNERWLRGISYGTQETGDWQGQTCLRTIGTMLDATLSVLKGLTAKWAWWSGSGTIMTGSQAHRRLVP